jgi:hypothetical protein
MGSVIHYFLAQRNLFVLFSYRSQSLAQAAFFHLIGRNQAEPAGDRQLSFSRFVCSESLPLSFPTRLIPAISCAESLRICKLGCRMYRITCGWKRLVVVQVTLLYPRDMRHDGSGSLPACDSAGQSYIFGPGQMYQISYKNLSQRIAISISITDIAME